eukprot:354634-Karenia_brevis.AAC.1
MVAESFVKFKDKVTEFTRREGRQPSRHSSRGDERHLGEQVHNCLSGHRKLEPEQIEELRVCLRHGHADGATTSISRKRKADAAADVASDVMRSEPDALPAVPSETSDAESGPPLGEEAIAAPAAEHDQSMVDPARSPLAAEQQRYWATPGALLPHMRVAPRDLKDVQVTGFARWNGPPLACPPDG